MKRTGNVLLRLCTTVLACTALWAAAAYGGADADVAQAARALTLRQVHAHLTALSPADALTLRQSPYLLAAEYALQEDRSVIAESLVYTPDNAAPLPRPTLQPLVFTDNGVPAQTVQVTDPKGYAAVGSVYIKNSSGKTVDSSALTGHTPPAPDDTGPQVLILHTHGSEAYTLPPGQSYVSTGTCRTADAAYSVVRVGDEIAAVLSSYGISVLHDRTLYDDPLYNGAYARSEEGAAAYLEKYPSLYYILDIHRDAVEDGNHNQYKLVSAEDSTVAQMSFVIGTNHEQWQQNLALAVAVTEQVQQDFPTAMRPIILRSSRYNQHLSPGALLLEVGAAGNSPEEALHASRIFADALAEVILAP